jgi:hypothetical protein
MHGRQKKTVSIMHGSQKLNSFNHPWEPKIKRFQSPLGAKN